MKGLISVILILLFFCGELFSQERSLSAVREIIHHSYYTLVYSEVHEQAEYVYYKLTPERLKASTKRTNSFRVDPKVTTGSASSSDYTGSGFDRGHLCPAGSMAFNETAMSESFYMSNISPQYPSFNRGAWRQLENQVREWAPEDSVLHIVTGIIFTDSLGVIGKNKVTIPRYYYKIIYSPKYKIVKSYILTNTPHTTIYKRENRIVFTLAKFRFTIEIYNEMAVFNIELSNELLI